jgi:hypothetical protein
MAQEARFVRRGDTVNTHIGHQRSFEVHNKGRVDMTFYLCHFTKVDVPCVKGANNDVVKLPHERFAEIFKATTLRDCALPHLPPRIKAVCFRCL